MNSYGKVHNFKGEWKGDCPFRYQGQYEDAETGLYYNRFRYYSPDEGMYISQDPIRLAGGKSIYGYVHNPNAWVDRFGLESCDDVEKTRELAEEAEGADELKKCKEFAKDLKSKMKEEGITGEHYEITLNTHGGLISDTHGTIAEGNSISGAEHQYIKVGDTVFDNMNPQGTNYDDFMHDLGLDSVSPAVYNNTPLNW